MKKIILSLLAFSVVLSGCNLPRPTAEPPPPTSSPTPPTLVEAPPREIDLRAVSIVSPSNGETYPFLAYVPVLVAAISSAPIVRQELLVNDAVAITQTGEKIGVSFSWLANQPGANRLQVRLQTEDGREILSPAVEVNVSPQPVGFDILHPTSGGETFAGLAGQFGLNPRDVAAYNPEVSAALDAPLPAGLLIRLPVEPSIPADVLARVAPGVDPSILEGGGGSAPASGGIPPFAPPLAPSFDIKFPPAFDKIYYYLSLDSGPWSRVPRLPDEFIVPAGGMFNLQEALKGVVAPPAQGTLRAEIDAWGWSGGALIYIGRFERIFNAEPGREPFAITPGELTICDLPAPACQQGLGNFVQETTDNAATTRELRWIPPAGAEGGLWQVSRFPFEPVCAPEPGGVFRSGGVSVNGAAQVSFNLDFPAPGTDAYSIPLPLPGGGTQTLQSAWFAQPYYARVLPVFAGQAQCVPSNQVMITMDPNKQEVKVVTPTPLPAAPVPPVLFDVEIVDFTPIQFPQGKFAHCVVIEKNPFYEQNSNVVDGLIGGPYYVNGNSDATLLQYIPPGTILCPKPYQYQEPSFLEKAGQALKDALNAISFAYEVLKTLAVKLVVKAIPYCYAGEFLESYKDEIDSVCNAAAEVIVQAAMTYVGLPPSIPNYEQLKETAKGKLTELAVEQLEEQTGLPCIEVCQDFIRERVDEIWAAGEDLLSSRQSGCIDAASAHNQGFEPLCLPGNVETTPDPRGILQPAQVQARLTRRADAPESALPNPLLFDTSCALVVQTDAVNNAYVGQSIFLMAHPSTGAPQYWQGSTLYGYNLFKPEKLNLRLNDLAPGESKDFYLALQPNRGKYPPSGSSNFWLPGRLPLLQTYLSNNWVSTDNWVAWDDWEYYYLGAELNVTASALCTTKPNSAQPLAPSTSQSSDAWVEQISAEK